MNLTMWKIPLDKTLGNGVGVLLQIVATSMLILLGLVAALSIFAYDLIVGTQLQHPPLDWMMFGLVVAICLGSLGAVLTRTYLLPGSHSWRPRNHWRQVMVAASVLAVVASICAIEFLGQSHKIYKTVGDGLNVIARNHTSSLNTLLHLAEVGAKANADRPGLVHAMRNLSNTDSTDNRTALTEIVGKMRAAGYSSVKLLNANFKTVAEDGADIDKPSVLANLGMHRNLSLIWNGQYWLRSVENVRDEIGSLGTLVLEQPFPLLDAAMSEFREHGDHATIDLCARADGKVICFPRMHTSDATTVQSSSHLEVAMPFHEPNNLTPDVYLAKNDQGLGVIVAYTPIDEYGLALSVSETTDNLYQPLRYMMIWVACGVLTAAALSVWVARLRTSRLKERLNEAVNQLTERERRIHAISDHVHDGVVTVDQNGLITAINPYACELFGYREAELLGLHISILIPSQTSKSFALDSDLEWELDTPSKPRYTPIEMFGQKAIRKDGSPLSLEMCVKEIRLGAKVLCVYIVRDGEPRRHAEDTIEDLKKQMDATLEAVGVAAADGIITTNTSGVVSQMNSVAETLTGWKSQEARGRTLARIFNLADETTLAPVRNAVDSLIRGDSAGAESRDKVLFQRGGGQFIIEEAGSVLKDPNGHLLGYVTVFRDVGHLRGLMKQIAYQASHDPLTGLLNRREFEHQLDLARIKCRFDGQNHCLLYLDLDRFKDVNDSCGHAAGDELLKQFTAILQHRVRNSDTIGRLGGDEFGVLLDGSDELHGKRIAESLREAVGEFRFAWNDKLFELHVSIGLVAFSGNDQPIESLMNMADAACYIAKAQGRNRIHAYVPADIEFAHHQGDLGWVNRIEQALNEHQFVLHSQRIMCSDESDTTCKHYEFLLRMQDDGGGLIPPMAFLPAAQRHGLMPRLDRWVVNTALGHFHSMCAGADCVLLFSVNISSASISDPDFPRFLKEKLLESQVPPSSLCLEISESDATANLAAATEFIYEVRNIGCRVALDDFGGGNASFAYLKQLHVDFIKIDGKFVRDMMDDPLGYSMVDAINVIGHVMGMQTIAESTENADIRNALRKLGVDFAQGYGVSHASPIDHSQD